MPSPNTVQDRRRDRVGDRQSGGQYRGGDDEGDDAQPLGFENLAGERVFELRRQRGPCLALNEIADKCPHGVRQSSVPQRTTLGGGATPSLPAPLGSRPCPSARSRSR